MQIFMDIFNFFKFLNFVDIIFLVAVIGLLILIVTLIYFIKINKDVFNENDFFPEKPIENKNETVNKIEEVENNLAVEEEYNDEEPELIDLESLTKKLKEDSKNNDRINFTEYEKDQEEKAIISYDELLQKKNNYTINYEKEEMVDDLLIKKVNLNDLVNKNEFESLKEDEVRVISYQKEEAFLSALKELNSLLN